MKVSDLMNRSVVSVSPDDSAERAAELFARHNVGSLPVAAADGHLRGILTDRDIVVRCVAAEGEAPTTKVREIMSRGVVSVAPDADIREAAELMAAEQVRRLPVVDNGVIVGMLSIGDMARSQAYDMEASRALGDICTPGGKHY